MSNGKAKQRTQIDPADIYIRLPLIGMFKKPVVDGNNVYINSIDAERLKSVAAFFTKAKVGENTGTWLRYDGYDHIGQKPAISSEKMDEYLQSNLEMIQSMNHIFLDHPVLKELLQEIFDQKSIITAAQNADLSELGRSLEQYTFGIIGVVCKLIEIIEESKSKEALTHSAVSAIEHMPEDEANIWFVHAQAVQEYHASVAGLFGFQKSTLTNVQNWLGEIDQIVERKAGLVAELQELSDDVRDVVLAISPDGQEVARVKQRLENFLSKAKAYNEDCKTLYDLASELKTQQGSLNEKLRQALLAFKTLDSYKDQKGFSLLVLKKWIPDEVYNQTMDWAKEQIHLPNLWEADLVKLRSQINNSETLLEHIDSSKAEELLKTLPVVEQVNDVLVDDEDELTVESSVPLPTSLGSFGFPSLNPVTVGYISPAPDQSTVVPEKPAPQKKAIKVKPKTVREQYKAKLSDYEVDPDLPVPKTNRDLLELCILNESAKQPNANPLRGGTIGTLFATLTIAGFDLQNVSQQNFREYLQNSLEVDGDVGRVDNQHEVKYKYHESRKKLLVYNVDKGNPACKFRTKITQVHLSHESTLKRSEKAWGITRGALARCAAERKELLISE